MKTLTFILLMLGLLSRANAGDILQWTDENGRRHFGETVPEQYKKSAKKMEAGKTNIMQSQKPANNYVPPPDHDASPAWQPNNNPGAGSAPTGQESCREKMQRYRDSQACFIPYRNENGSLKPEAFKRCKEIPQPTECPG